MNIAKSVTDIHSRMIRSRLARLLLALYASTCCHWLVAQAATVTTDLEDYSPFSFVQITGAGFQPGEIVNNQVVQVEGPAAGTAYEPWSVTADTEGGFHTTWYVFTDDLIGTTLRLTATGQSSSLTATTTFSDSATTCPPPPTGTPLTGSPAGGFAMDGELQANANTGDWVPGSGSGGAVLGTNGMPVNPTTTFHLVDGFGAAENNFNGGLKVDNDPNLWTWVINPTTGKDDINHALIHISTASDGHRWLVVSADRAKNNGDSYVDFEFLQNSLSITTNAGGLTGGFVSTGPHGGRTTNDFLLTISFTRGGTTPGVCLERWLPSGTGFDYVDAPLPAGFVFGAVNTAVIPVPYGAFGGTTYDVNTFAEVAVDVTAMMAGFDRCLSVGVKSMMVKTKTSQSPQASIVDFITPLSIDLKLGPSADAGPDQAKCSAGASTTFTLDGKAYAGLDPVNSTNWSVVSGSATIDSTNSLSTSVHVTSASATLRLTLTTAVEGGCAKSDDVVLTVNQPSVCSITGTAPVCPSSTNTYSAPAGMDTYSWSISGNGTIVGSTSLQEVAVAAGSACNQDFTLTLTITKNGCPSTCSQNFLVRDITPPVISAAGADATINCPSTPVFTPPTATDTCDANPQIVEVSDVTTPGTCAGSYTRIKTWKAVDACGNESGTQSQTITVRDITGPIISDAGANGTIECPNTPVFAPPTATDACDPNPQIIEINDVTTPGTCAGSYTRTKTWKAVDSCGNESGTKSQAITVRDNTAPAIGDAGADATIDCPRTPVFTPPTATDACDSNPRIVEVSDVTTPGSCAGTYTRTKTWKAVDACGNESGMKSQTITVRDNTAPEISEAGAEETIDCPTTPVFTPPTATDACDPNPGIVEVSDVTTPGLVAGSYTRTKTWKAVDACGNGSETKSQTITIRDSTAPVIGDAGADATIDCPNTPVFTPPTATDACDSTPRIVEISDVTTPGACAGSYTRTKTWKAVDAAGNESGTKSQTITVQDKTAPVLGNPGANTTIECSNTPAFTPPTATDACDANPQIVEVSDVTTPGTCAGSYTRTKTWKAVDACGNESGTRSQTITVRDTTAPTISDAGANATIDCPNTPLFTPPTASDACDANPQLIEVSDVTTPGSCAGSYTRTKTWKAVDACGNASGLKSQTIAVHDTTAPFIGDAGANATIDCSTTPVFTPPTATDACDANPRIDEVSDVTTPGTCTGSYTRTKTWKAVDACGNESGTKSQTITVTDSTAPVITCPPNSRVAWSDSTATNATGVATATDSCDPNPLITYADTEAPGDCPNTKVITRTWTASDSCGNAASCAQKITVGDITPPTLQCPPTATVECNSATDPTVTGRATATSATGAVLTPSYSDSFAPGTCPNTKVITRTWTATDICGNTASCAQTINVVDSTAPRITCPADMTVDCSASTDPSATGSASATDNCDPNPTINHSDAATGVCPKIITRTWTATDCAGHTSSCTQKITIVDTTPPVITCPPDKTLEEHTSADPSFTGRATAIDNCDPTPTIGYSDVTNGVSIRIITRTWTATDCAGNQSKCVQTITVPDSLSGGNFLTDTMRCTLPGNQLRLIFTPDTKNMPCYKLNASNPGQFYYNVFYAGMPGESETFNVTLPYPWVTQGANPIEVYDGVTLTTSGGQTCLTPGRKVYAGSQQVTLANYGTKPVMGVSTRTLIITVTVPASGYVYLAIHLDFGLKASTGYNRNASDDATACANTAAILVPNNQSYTFSVAGEDNASATVSSYNTFKKNPGVGGLTQSLSTTFSVPGAAATLRDTRGLVLGTGVTDQDGWYLINYKATGKAATYSLTLTPPKGSGAAQKQAITLKSNGYVEADFTTP